MDCPLGKVPFATADAARAALGPRPPEGRTVFPCRYCQHWHTGYFFLGRGAGRTPSRRTAAA